MPHTPRRASAVVRYEHGERPTPCPPTRLCEPALDPDAMHCIAGLGSRTAQLIQDMC